METPKYWLIERNQDKAKKVIEMIYKLILICLNIALSSTVFGYFLIYLGALPFETVTDIYKITLSKGLAQGLLNGCIPIGGFVGALFGSALISYFSRR